MRKLAVLLWALMLLASCKAMPEGLSSALNSIDSRTAPAEQEYQRAEAEFENVFQALLQAATINEEEQKELLEAREQWKNRTEEALPWSYRKGSYDYYKAMTEATIQQTKKMKSKLPEEQHRAQKRMEERRIAEAEQRKVENLAWGQQASDSQQFLTQNKEKAIALVMESYHPSFLPINDYRTIGETYNLSFKEKNWNVEVSGVYGCVVLFTGINIDNKNFKFEYFVPISDIYNEKWSYNCLAVMVNGHEIEDKNEIKSIFESIYTQ